MRLGVLDVGNWPEAEVLVDEGLNDCVSLAKRDVHLNGALRVANVMRFLLGDVVDIGEERGQIIVCHMLESELPELLALVGVVLCVVSGVLVSSAVSQPDIVALVGQHEAWRFVLIVDEPSIRAVEKSVLQDNGLSSFFDLRALSLYPEDCENVAVLSDDSMSLNRIVVVFAVVNKF